MNCGYALDALSVVVQAEDNGSEASFHSAATNGSEVYRFFTSHASRWLGLEPLEPAPAQDRHEAFELVEDSV